MLAGGVVFGGWDAKGRTISAASASRADVGSAVSTAQDGDTVKIPAGKATWRTSLLITKNISLIGAGEGQTIITADLPTVIRNSRRKSPKGLKSPPLISVDLSHESREPQYSFRLSALTLKSANITPFANEHPYIKLVGKSNPAASPAPYVRGCVSRVRIDHMTWDKLNGLALLVESCLGVADHITADNGTQSSSMIKVFMSNWTPTKNPATGAVLPTTYLASAGYGSWADDSYWGSDKFWFFEDCNFTILNTPISDDEQGGRVVYRHCTVNNGTGFASHGMEGRRQPGVRAREIYNNYFITTRGLAQHRSGSTLYFNNKSTASPKGITLKSYRFQAVYTNWGGASGDNRYDQNPVDATLVASGTITAVASPGSATTASVTVGASDNLSAIDVTDGSMYVIQDTDDPYTTTNTSANGWKYNQSGISSIAGKVISLTTGTTPDSAHWQVGHHYQIRKVLVAYGAPGTGKGKLLNVASRASSGYLATWTYPSTSGTLARSPQAGFPLDPCYSWNNTDNSHGYLGFRAPVYLKSGRDYFNLSERPTETQNVGYPSVAYTRATSDYPDIGPDSDVPYAPYPYPHPLTRVDATRSGSD